MVLDGRQQMVMLSDALFVTAIFAFLILFLMVTP
jgi:hypothetical protein